MKQRADIGKKVEETLNSLDGIQRAEAQPWLYTRVNARLQREEKTTWTILGSFLSKPAVALAGVCVIVLLNAFLLVEQGKDTASTPSFASQTDQQLSESESIIASNSSFEYENLAQ